MGRSLSCSLACWCHPVAGLDRFPFAADKCVVVQVKLVCCHDNTCHTWVLLRWSSYTGVCYVCYLSNSPCPGYLYGFWFTRVCLHALQLTVSGGYCCCCKILGLCLWKLMKFIFLGYNYVIELCNRPSMLLAAQFIKSFSSCKLFVKDWCQRSAALSTVTQSECMLFDATLLPGYSWLLLLLLSVTTFI